MKRFWSVLLEPLIDRMAPRQILEVGADAGGTTLRLLEYCARTGASLDVVDPFIHPDIRARAAQLGPRVAVHARLSLGSLPTVPYPDLALIDGDHNWFTVINELRLLERRAHREQRDFPVVVLHDVGWPYGRRDLYYDPATVPGEHRWPFARGGLAPGADGLVSRGGINRLLLHATHENGPRNGVRAAIEDFLAESTLELDFIDIPGFNGLALLLPAAHRRVTPFIEELRQALTPFTRRYLEALESDRLRRELGDENGYERIVALSGDHPEASGAWDRVSQQPYLELLKRALTDLIQLPPGQDPTDRLCGREWPPPERAHTMVGLRRLDNIEKCVTGAIARGVPGDLIEAGVWRGGAAIFMRGLLMALGDPARRVWVADSFAGVPPPDAERYPADAGDEHHRIDALAVPLEEVKENFRRYGLLDERVCFVEGWFKDTLEGIPAEEFAVIRLDGDLYQSTMEALVALYPRLAAGGSVIIDDYGAVPACRQAVQDYRAAHHIDEPIQRIDWTGAFWHKPPRARWWADWTRVFRRETAEGHEPDAPAIISGRGQRAPRRANLFVLGAAKCATSALHQWLDRHPEICMSREKEPYFFEAEYARGPDYYQEQYFPHASGERYVGEARHRNLYLPHVPERIREYNPQARLLVVVRHPIERAVSHWWHWHERGEEPAPPGTAFLEDLARLERRPPAGPGDLAKQLRKLRAAGHRHHFSLYDADRRTYLDSGHYAEQIARYDAVFPPSQIRIVSLDDLVDRPEETLEGILRFLELQPAAEQPLELPLANDTRSLEAHFGLRYRKWLEQSRHPSAASAHLNQRHRHLLDAPLVTLLERHYEPHVRALERRMERSLGWMESTSGGGEGTAPPTVDEWLSTLEPRLPDLLAAHGTLAGVEEALRPLFDAEFYRSRDAGARQSALGAFEHYLAHGDRAGAESSPGPWFDPGYYALQLSEDVRGSLLLHYVQDGFERGLEPGPLLSHEARQRSGDGALPVFLEQLRDLGAHGHSSGEPTKTDSGFRRKLRHHARSRGLPPQVVDQSGPALPRSLAARFWHYGSLFDPVQYLERYADLRAAGAEPHHHYYHYGQDEGRRPSWIFDTAYYLESHPEARDSTLDPVSHYLEIGAGRGWSPHPLFGPEFYASQGPEPARPELTPLEHYLAFGASNRCDPSPWFDTEYYLAQVREPLPDGETPLVHYLRVGWRQGLPPSPLTKVDGLPAPPPRGPHSDAIPFVEYLRASSPTIDLARAAPPADDRPRTSEVVVYASGAGNYFMRQLADLYGAGLEGAGVSVRRADEDTPHPSGTLPVVVAPHEFFTLGKGPDRQRDLLPRACLINTEQIDTPFFARALPFLTACRAVFDLSPTMAGLLRRRGLRAEELPLGHVEGFAPFDAAVPAETVRGLPGLPPQARGGSFPPADWTARPLDVVFLGTPTERRLRILGQLGRILAARPCYMHTPVHDQPNVASHGGVTAEASVGLSRITKVVLNLHQGDHSYFEWHRVALLGLWQQALVVSEPCERIGGLQPNEHFIECRADELGETLKWLLDTPAGRAKAEAVSEAGHRTFVEKMAYAELLRSQHLPALFA